MGQEVLQHLLMHGGIPHHAFFTHLFPAGLELGLDEAGDLTPLPQQAVQRREDQLQGDEGHVDAGKIQRIGDLLRSQIPGVGALHAHHTGVAAELPVQLAVAHVHGIDLPGAVLQHTVRKAPGGGADVGTDLIGQGDGKGLHGLFQLQSAPAHIGQGVATNLDGGVTQHRRAGLIHPLARHEHVARHDDGLCLLAALRQTTLRQEYVQPCFIAHAQPPLPQRRRPQRPVRRDDAAPLHCPVG